MPRTLHSLLVAAQEGDPKRVKDHLLISMLPSTLNRNHHLKVAAILDSGEVGINAADESEITAIQV